MMKRLLTLLAAQRRPTLKMLRLISKLYFVVTGGVQHLKNKVNAQQIKKTEGQQPVQANMELVGIWEKLRSKYRKPSYFDGKKGRNLPN